LTWRLIAALIVLVLVVASALGVVYTRHESRRQAVTLGNLENQRDAHLAEWSRLQLEQAWLADAGHVEKKARDELQMSEPPERQVLVVRP
jgi:cell division protein FtsL